MAEATTSKSTNSHRGRVGVVIVAAGQSRRMGGQDKLFLPLLGRPTITYSVQAFHDSPLVDQIVVVAMESNVARMNSLVDEHGWHKIQAVCTGGRRRQDSVRAGLECVPDTAWTIVHDGARPVVSARIIEDGLREARETGAATAGIPVVDTIKRAGDGLHVMETLDRGDLWTIQTPQVFKTEMLHEAHQRDENDVTDDAALIEKAGGAVKIFAGDPDNIKVTTPADILIAEAILKRRAEALVR